MQKIKPFRSKKYLKWVSSLECCNCGAPPPNDPHHIKHVGGFSGAGMKAPDNMTMALCGGINGCHSKLHDSPDMWELQYEWIARTWQLAIQSRQSW